MSKYDCVDRIAEHGGPNLQLFVIQNLKEKTQRRRAGHGGRVECIWEPVDRETDYD